MKKINEEFLHFLWKNQHLTGVTFYTEHDFKLEVLDPGMHNHDAGPDFCNAKIRIGNTTWAGNVELHINASDWLRHGHSDDPAYNTVILHVVYFNDCEITRKSGEQIPTAILRFPIMIWETYEDLRKNNNWIPCQHRIRNIKTLQIAQWTSSLMIQKLEDKNNYLSSSFKDVTGHWDALLTRSLIRSFGIPVNTFPFELLGLAIPYNLLLRNKNTLFSLEAILFGTAGFLDTKIPDDQYAESLRLEYFRISGNTSKPGVPLQSWKFMRMRPSSFPTLRIAQLAALIHNCFPLHKLITAMPDLTELQRIFKVRASDYWNTHYQFGRVSDFRYKYLGRQFIHTLIINTLVPYLTFYARTLGKKSHMDYALDLLEVLPPEKNVILKKWGTFGIKCTNALESQALLYLYKSYCKQKECLKCQFGNTLLIDGKDPKKETDIRI